MEDFGSTLDPIEWRSAFESSEPHDANRTMVVTGDHSAMLNAYVEASSFVDHAISHNNVPVGSPRYR